MIRPRMRGGDRQRGFTLIELMIVVAIIAVLATLAVYMFTKQANKAKSTEVNAVFAEIRTRQEQYHLEQGSYATTTATNDADLAEYLPAGSPSNVERTLNVPAGAWSDLRFNPDRQALYCGYVTVGGTGGALPSEANLAAAAPFNLCEPPCSDQEIPDADDYFYMVAQCDFDGDSTNSTYFSVSFTDGTAVDNRGE